MALLHGLHAQVIPRLNLPCFSDVLWRATVGRCARKSAACAELWGLIFLCRVKVHTVRVFQWPSWRALASQNLLGSGFLVHRTHPYPQRKRSTRLTSARGGGSDLGQCGVHQADPPAARFGAQLPEVTGRNIPGFARRNPSLSSTCSTRADRVF